MNVYVFLYSHVYTDNLQGKKKGRHIMFICVQSQSEDTRKVVPIIYQTLFRVWMYRVVEVHGARKRRIREHSKGCTKNDNRGKKEYHLLFIVHRCKNRETTG